MKIIYYQILLILLINRNPLTKEELIHNVELKRKNDEYKNKKFKEKQKLNKIEKEKEEEKKEENKVEIIIKKKEI